LGVLRIHPHLIQIEKFCTKIQQNLSTYAPVYTVSCYMKDQHL
jgi:hypothetical protein